MGEVQHVLLPASAPAAVPHAWGAVVTFENLGLGKTGQGCAAAHVAAYFAVAGTQAGEKAL